MFTKFLYIQVRENRFIVRDPSGPSSVPLQGDASFSSRRLLLADFNVARSCLKELLIKARGTWFPLIMKVVIHPLEKIEDGLAPIEKMAFKELAEQAGAAEAIVWTGPGLSDLEVIAKIKEKN